MKNYADNMFQAIDSSLAARRLGYNISPTEAYSIIEYEEQIEDEGEWDEPVPFGYGGGTT